MKFYEVTIALSDADAARLEALTADARKVLGQEIGAVYTLATVIDMATKNTLDDAFKFYETAYRAAQIDGEAAK